MKIEDEQLEPPRRYHHRDLRKALLDAAVARIAESGPAAVSLRELARQVGVSHAAPVHHFGDKAGLMTALAADGFRRLAVSLGEAYAATGSFLEVGVAYAVFVERQRPYVEVMFRPELYHGDDPELVAARDASRVMLYGPLQDISDPSPDLDTLRAGVAASALVHGLSLLWLNGALPPGLGDDLESITRSVAVHLFPGAASAGAPVS